MSRSDDVRAGPEPGQHPTAEGTPLGALLDVFQIRQYFDALVCAADLAGAFARDAGFVNDVRRAVIRLPFERRPQRSFRFPPADAPPPGLEPIPFQKVRATGFYRQFIDNRDWPDFMLLGRAAMLDALRRRRGAWGCAPAGAEP
jgi:hypothetical protein